MALQPGQYLLRDCRVSGRKRQISGTLANRFYGTKLQPYGMGQAHQSEWRSTGILPGPEEKATASLSHS